MLAAIRSFQSVPYVNENCATPTWIVQCGGDCRIRFAQKKSFHVPWNSRIATAASAGPASGSITRQNVLKYPAPSSFAASSRSRGIVKKYCRIRNSAPALTMRIAQ